MMTTHDDTESPSPPFSAHPGPSAAVRSAVNEFRSARLRKGQPAADRDFFEPILREWLARLDGTAGPARRQDSAQAAGSPPSHGLTPPATMGEPGTETVPSTGQPAGQADFLIRLGVSLQESSAMRDAILLSLISTLSADDLLAIGTRPGETKVMRLVARTMSGLFDGPTSEPDQDRCRRGANLLCAVDTAAAAGYTAQSKAVLAYTLWWMDLAQAATQVARQCVRQEAGCVLGRLLLGFLDRRIDPPWKSAAIRSDGLGERTGEALQPGHRPGRVGAEKRAGTTMTRE